MKLPNKGITTYLVCKAVGTSNHNIGGLCTSEHINKWSVYKPVRMNKVEMTDADFKAANYGFNVIPYNYPSQALRDYDAGNVWNYLRPRGNQVSTVEYYRLGDFRKYDSEAEPWCNLTIPNNTKEYAYGENIHIVYNYNGYGQDLKWIMDNMGAFSPYVSTQSDRNLLYVGFLIYNGNGAFNGKLCYYCPVVSYNDYLQGDSGTNLMITIPEKGVAGSPASGDYTILPTLCYGRVGDALGSWNLINENDPNTRKGGEWFVLPSDKIHINISNISSTDPVARGAFELEILNFNYNAGEKGNDASITFTPRLIINDVMTHDISYVSVEFIGPLVIGATPTQTGRLKFYKSNGTEQMIEGSNIITPTQGNKVTVMATPSQFSRSNLEFADNTVEYLTFDVLLTVKITNPKHITYNGYLNIAFPSDSTQSVNGIGTFQVHRE